MSDSRRATQRRGPLLLAQLVKMKKVDFRVTRAEALVISQITARAMRLVRKHGLKGCDQLTIEMDITATHKNGCPLKLSELLEAPDFHFVHDVFGIARHLDRTTGQLRNCFIPRFASRYP